MRKLSWARVAAWRSARHHLDRVKTWVMRGTLEPFADPQAWLRRAAEEEAERLATFLGGSRRLAWRC